jgi:hypothetical protein
MGNVSNASCSGPEQLTWLREHGLKDGRKRGRVHQLPFLKIITMPIWLSGATYHAARKRQTTLLNQKPANNT